MDTAASTFYWARFAAVALIAVLAVVFALRRSRPKAARRDLLVGVVGLVGFALVVFVTEVAVSPLITPALLVAGVAVGYLTGKVRPVAAWLSALTIVFAAIMLLFGEPRAVAFGFSVLALGIGLQLGLAAARKPAAGAQPGAGAGVREPAGPPPQPVGVAGAEADDRMAEQG